MKGINKYFKRKGNVILLSGILFLSLIPISAGVQPSDDNYFEISKNLEIFSDIYKDLNLYYVDEIDPNQIMRIGIDAMLASLDPYTNYISEAEMEGYRLQTTGRYGGIGAMIRKKGDYIAIVESYENSPAFKSGIQAGDIILQVNNKSIEGKSVDEVDKILKGQPGTEVTLLIKRPDIFEEKIYILKREDIVLENVPYYGMVNERVGYIRLDQFTDAAGRNVENALKELQKNTKLTGIILDLRGNPGGLLHEAVNVSNIFIEKNKLVVSTKGKVMEQDYKTINQPADLDIPLAVLTNRGSASASEIVAGVIQDYDRGVIIGQQTFGKGLVQQTRNVSYKTKLKLTTAKYYMPSGRCIQAIDYSHRNDDGSVAKIPDSLKNSFKTTKGRVVYDGGGIAPDVEIEDQKFSNITLSLLNKDLIFDYATKYKNAHATIAPAKEFSLTDQEYGDFIVFLSNRDYDYQTKTEKLLGDLMVNAKEEKYYDAVNSELNMLQSKIKHDKEKDLYKFKHEIKELLESEIVSRYYAQTGRIEASFDDDPDILKALYYFNNKEAYNNMLNTGK